MRMPGRTGAAALAKWAALTEAQPAARSLCEEMNYEATWEAAYKEMEIASTELATLGLTADPIGPSLQKQAMHKVQSCTCTAEIHAHDVLKQQAAPFQDRSRLQGRGGKLLDLHRLAGAWDSLPTEQQEAIHSQAGPGEGTLFGDLSSDEREGWLQDHHFNHAALARLGAPVCAPGHFCALRVASGPRAGLVCQQPLGRDGRHLVPCRAGGIATRLHHALRRRLTLSLNEQGLRAEEEIVLPELTQVTPSGIVEGRMDIVVSRPGGVSRTLIDVATCDGRAASYADTDAAFGRAEREKHQRYAERAWAFGVEHRGKLNRFAVEVLENLAREAVLVRGGRPATIVRKWRRQLQMVTAFEVAEIMRHQLCGVEDGDRRENGAVRAKLAVGLDDAVLGRIEENRLRAINLREQKRAQQLEPTAADGQVLPPPLPHEDEYVFGFGGCIDDHQIGGQASSLPVSGGTDDSSSILHTGDGGSSTPACSQACVG